MCVCVCVGVCVCACKHERYRQTEADTRKDVSGDTRTAVSLVGAAGTIHHTVTQLTVRDAVTPWALHVPFRARGATW